MELQQRNGSSRACAVVLGGAGFIGSRLCEVLLAQGYDVVSVDNESTGRSQNVGHLFTDPAFRCLPWDVTEPFDVPGRVDLVLCLASPASPVHYLALPIETMKAGSLGTLHGLELAERKHARFVLASTSEVYGDPTEHPQRESYWGNVNPIGPRAVYDEAKRFAEALTSAYRRDRGVDTAIVRIFNTYGPRMRTDDGRAVPTFIGQALRGGPLTVAGDGSQTRSLCYVDDTVAGIVRMALSRHTGPVNIGNTAEISMLGLARDIVELTGTSAAIEYVDRPVDDPGQRCPDTSLAQRLLGWHPTTPRDAGLAKTVAWMRTAAAAEAVIPAAAVRP
ncbi:MAG TPA: NAD-dependent epimerase/dehydratase family protein [Nocardioidaceae bacterium]|nr:NAD-dependent epimerase/dehydratase family protein [Nocardioidaceae bacterium]